MGGSLAPELLCQMLRQSTPSWRKVLITIIITIILILITTTTIITTTIITTTTITTFTIVIIFVISFYQILLKCGMPTIRNQMESK